MKYLGSTRGAVMREAEVARSQRRGRLVFGVVGEDAGGREEEEDEGGSRRLASGDLYSGCFIRFLALRGCSCCCCCAE